MNEPVYIIDGNRTPFLKSRNRPGPFAASDLATDAGRALLLRQRFDATQLDEVILGCAAPSADEVNIGRVAALRMGCGLKVPGWTVMRNCASGMQSIDSAVNNIRAGRSNLVLAGGVDALSRAPLLFSDAMVMWLSKWYAAKSVVQRAALLAQFRPGYLAPVIALMKGLTDPICGLLMGQTAENLAHRFAITRQEMDAYSAGSHAKVLAAQKAGHFADELVALYDKSGKVYAADDGVREDSTAANLAKLRPFFDRKYGNVTAGNSSQITDGGAWVVVASARAVDEHKLTPLGRIVDSQWQVSTRRRWVSVRCTRLHRSCNVMAWVSPISTRGKSTRPLPRRCLRASVRGPATITAATNSDCRRHWVPSTRRGSTSTAARLRSAIRWAHPARASCCMYSTCCAVPAASAAWPPSASVAGLAAPC